MKPRRTAGLCNCSSKGWLRFQFQLEHGMESAGRFSPQHLFGEGCPCPWKQDQVLKDM